jgi:hypothetical protein
MTKQRTVIREILRRSPGSLRRLARDAGITHVALIRARRGEFPLSPERVAAVIRTLRSWSRTCAELADRLEATVHAENTNEEEDDGKA